MPPISWSPNSWKKQKMDLAVENNKTQFPNWLELLEDIWLLIFSKLKTIEIIDRVQRVCMLFRRICKRPSLFRSIDLRLPPGYTYNNLPFSLSAMTRYALHSSAGGLLNIHIDYLCDDDAFMYIIDRCKNLESLSLGEEVCVSDDALIEAVKKLPVLKGIHIVLNSFADETVEAIGHACPSLLVFLLNAGASFMLNAGVSKTANFVYNGEALAISRSMPKLERLQLLGNGMNNEGLEAILDGCPHLDFLDVRRCFHINLSGVLGERIAANKQLLCLFDDYSSNNRSDASYGEDGGGPPDYHPEDYVPDYYAEDYVHPPAVDHPHPPVDDHLDCLHEDDNCDYSYGDYPDCCSCFGGSDDDGATSFDVDAFIDYYSL